MSLVASIVVCTRDRPELLDRCLASLVADTSSTSRELLVVDNAPARFPAAAAVERAAKAAPFPVRYVLEPRLGLSHARNRALREVRGEVVLWTDDDVAVEPGWADELVRAFDDPGVVAAAGRILPAWPYPPPAWLDGPHAVHLTLEDLGTTARLLSSDETPTGANMAFRTAAGRALGTPFDPSLGHRGSLCTGYEERRFFRRLAAAGATAYRPAAIAHHHISPARMSWDSLRHAWTSGGLGLARAERLDGEELPGLARRLVRALRTARGATTIRRRNERGPQSSADDAWREFYAFMWAGRDIERLLGRFPRLSEWVVGRLAC